MAKTEISGCNFDGGFSSLIFEENSHDEEHPAYQHSNQYRQPVSTYSMTARRHCTPAAVILALLAALLLIVDIGLGAHYNKLTDTHLTLNDTERISNELAKLQDTYKTAVESMKAAKKRLDSEMSRQTPTNWELEHQTKRSKDYEVQLEKMTTDVSALRYYFPMINDGCRQCPPGWILINSVCYYFSISNNVGFKSWQRAREYCQIFGGDLAIIDSKDKENTTVNYLMNFKDPTNPNMGFWIGVRDFPKEGTWKWVNRRVLVEGYWDDGEPNSILLGEEGCGVVNAKKNFFKAWSDVKCGTALQWICEKAPTSMS